MWLPGCRRPGSAPRQSAPRTPAHAGRHGSGCRGRPSGVRAALQLQGARPVVAGRPLSCRMPVPADSRLPSARSTHAGSGPGQRRVGLVVEGRAGRGGGRRRGRRGRRRRAGRGGARTHAGRGRSPVGGCDGWWRAAESTGPAGGGEGARRGGGGTGPWAASLAGTRRHSITAAGSSLQDVSTRGAPQPRVAPR